MSQHETIFLNKFSRLKRPEELIATALEARLDRNDFGKVDTRDAFQL